jgi:hypothetical protein
MGGTVHIENDVINFAGGHAVERDMVQMSSKITDQVERCLHDHSITYFSAPIYLLKESRDRGLPHIQVGETAIISYPGIVTELVHSLLP